MRGKVRLMTMAPRASAWHPGCLASSASSADAGSAPTSPKAPALEAVSVAQYYLDTGRAHRLRHRVAWLYSVAYFAAVRVVQHEPPCVSLPIEELEKVLRRRHSTGPDAVLTSAMKEALSVLSPRQRGAVELHVLEERSFRDAADALGVSIRSFRTHLQRALSRMREELMELLPPRFSNPTRV